MGYIVKNIANAENSARKVFHVIRSGSYTLDGKTYLLEQLCKIAEFHIERSHTFKGGTRKDYSMLDETGTSDCETMRAVYHEAVSARALLEVDRQLELITQMCGAEPPTPQWLARWNEVFSATMPYKGGDVTALEAIGRVISILSWADKYRGVEPDTIASSAVLEKIDDIGAAWGATLNRISGLRNIFEFTCSNAGGVSADSPYALPALFYSDYTRNERAIRGLFADAAKGWFDPRNPGLLQGVAQRAKALAVSDEVLLPARGSFGFSGTGNYVAPTVRQRGQRGMAKTARDLARIRAARGATKPPSPEDATAPSGEQAEQPAPPTALDLIAQRRLRTPEA